MVGKCNPSWYQSVAGESGGKFAAARQDAAARKRLITLSLLRAPFQFLPFIFRKPKRSSDERGNNGLLFLHPADPSWPPRH